MNYLSQQRIRDTKYTIHKNGRVYSEFVGRFLQNRLSNRGYYHVLLTENGIEKNHLIHRLVATAFIPNPDNKPQVNHKDGNKLNNNLDNLEWCTNRENAKHSYENGLTKHENLVKASNISAEILSKPVAQYDLDGNIINIFKSFADAGMFLGKQSGGSNIGKMIGSNFKQVYGYKWRLV